MTLPRLVGRYPQMVATAAGVLLVGLIGLLDYLIGPEILLGLLYLVPISLAAWFAGSKSGILVSCLSTAAWVTANVIPARYSHPAIAYWNAAWELGFFLVVSLLVSRLKVANEGLEAKVREKTSEMEKARQIQDRLLPSPETVSRLGAAFLYKPASEVGGDYLDIRPMPGGTVLLAMADVIGHGVPAAMGAAILKTLLGHACDQAARPDRVLATIRRDTADILVGSDFASMIVVALDRSASRLWYASAGHPCGYLIQPDRPIRGLPATGPLLGIPGTQAWETVSMDVRPGDRLVLVTDGLMDAANEAGEQFGRQRLETAVEEFRADPPDRLCRHIMERVRAFRGVAAQNDDMTILAIEA